MIAIQDLAASVERVVDAHGDARSAGVGLRTEERLGEETLQLTRACDRPRIGLGPRRQQGQRLPHPVRDLRVGATQDGGLE